MKGGKNVITEKKARKDENDETKIRKGRRE